MNFFNLFKKEKGVNKSSNTNSNIDDELALSIYKSNISDKEIEALNKANKNYQEDEDLNAVIEVYEYIFSKPNYWNTASHKFRLIEYYWKANRNDSAWKLLNQMIIENPDYLYKTRYYQYKQLKNESNYTEALKMWYLYCFNDYKLITCWDDSMINKFDKEAKALCKKKGISQEKENDLKQTLLSIVKDKSSNEGIAYKKFIAWYNEAK